MADEGECQVPPRSLDAIDGAELEEAIRRNKDFIVKNLNVMNLFFSPVSFQGIISEDENGKIRSCHEDIMIQKAAEIFIGAILRSNDETKWSVFKEALKRSQGVEIIKMVVCGGHTKELIIHESDQAQIRLQQGLLAETWEAELVSNALFEQQVLTSQEHEEVTAKLRNYGNMTASYFIINLVARKKGFFRTLQKVLWKLGYKKCAKEMDSDFCKKLVEKYTPSNSDIEADPRDSDNSNENGGYSIGVNIMEHYESMPYDKGDNSVNNVKEYYSLACDGSTYAVNYAKDYKNDDKKKHENKMGCFNKWNINTQDDNEPIASRTRSKTKLKQMRDSGENLPQQPVLHDRPSCTPHKPKETLPAEQVVKQYPLFNSNTASKQCVQLNDATINARLREDNKQTNLLQKRDPDETLLKQPIVDCRPSGTSQKPMKTLPAEQIVTQYPIFYSNTASKQCVQLNDAAINARLREDNKQTNLLQKTDPDETHLKQPVSDNRLSGTIKTPRDNLPVEQAVIQYPVCYSSSASEKCVQSKDAGFEARLQEDNKRTRLLHLKAPNKTVLMLPGASQKPRETLPAEPVVFQHPISHPSGAIRKCVQGKDVDVKARLQEHNKQTKHEVRLVACVCNKRFISEDALRKHKSKDCQVTFGHDHDKTSPLASHNNGATVRRSPDIFSPECSGNKNERQEYLIRMEECDTKTFHSTARSLNAKTSARKPKFSTDNKTQSPATRNIKRCTCGKQFISQETLERHRSFDCTDRQKVPEDTKSRSGTLVKAQSNTQSNEKTAGAMETDYRKQMRKCACGKIFISEAHLKEHKRKDCHELSQLANQTDEDDPSVVTRLPDKEDDLVLLEPNMHRARTESRDNSLRTDGVTNNVLRNTVAHSGQSNEGTHQNYGDSESTQQTASASGFGFQSSRTLQLHKKP